MTREEAKEQVMENLKKLIGNEYNIDDYCELQEDIDCAFDYRLEESDNDEDYEVSTSGWQDIPFNSAKRIDAYDMFVNVYVEIVRDGNTIRVTDVY